MHGSYAARADAAHAAPQRLATPQQPHAHATARPLAQVSARRSVAPHAASTSEVARRRSRSIGCVAHGAAAAKTGLTHVGGQPFQAIIFVLGESGHGRNKWVNGSAAVTLTRPFSKRSVHSTWARNPSSAPFSMQPRNLELQLGVRYIEKGGDEASPI